MQSKSAKNLQMGLVVLKICKIKITTLFAPHCSTSHF